MVSELWRHSEQRGYYTRLLNPAASILSEMGLEYLDDDLPEATCLADDMSIKVPAPRMKASCMIAWKCSEVKEIGPWPTGMPGFMSMKVLTYGGLVCVFITCLTNQFSMNSDPSP